MAVYTLGLPDGREVELEAPEGVSEQEIIAYVNQQWEAGAFGQPQQSQQSQQPQTESFGQGLVGLGETALTMGTGLASSAIGGAKNLLDVATGQQDIAGAAEDIRKFQEEYTYTPKSSSGQAIMQGISRPFQAMDEGMQTAGGAVLEATDSPALATATYIAPDVIGAIFGLQGMRQLRAGTQLKKGGMPTRELRDALEKHGIVYENMTPQAKALIPDVAPKTKVTGKPIVDETIEKAVAKDVSTGGTQSGLAQYKTYGEKLFKDPAASEAIKQQWREGDVQMAKSATPETKRGMQMMLNIMERTKKDSSLNIRPSDIVGAAANKRLRFIANKAEQARLKLDQIALKDLRGKPMNTDPVESAFKKSIEDLDIGFRMKRTPDGDYEPEFDFRGSIIQEDPSSQRVIQQLARLLSSGGKPDALRFHMLKRQIDALIEWNKQPTQGITKSGKNVLKDVRTKINQGLRDSNAEYAKVNDTLSTSLQFFDQMDRATTSRITVANTLSDPRAMGQELRKLFTNYSTRVELENAIKALDDTVNKLKRSDSKELAVYTGQDTALPATTFNDSVYQLARFANSLDDRFGAVARGTFQGRIESALDNSARALTQGTTAAVTQGVADKIRQMARGKVDDYRAYRSMEDILKGEQ